VPHLEQSIGEFLLEREGGMKGEACDSLPTPLGGIKEEERDVKSLLLFRYAHICL
jgi:hypothetical protein